MQKESRLTPGVTHSFVNPEKVPRPRSLVWSESLAQDLGLSAPNEDDIEVLAGNQLSPGMKPFAMVYAGHQFGHFAGQLGDGRAITLGDIAGQEIQLKGAGLTPYSRHADGKAVLRSSLREYVASEAMHALGVPTTRALSLLLTGESVLRDFFYDGNVQREPGAIVARVAPTFVRFGNFEMHAVRNERKILQDLADWTIANHFSEFENSKDKYPLWFEEVCRRTALMVVHWMRVGFVHGVMNTDNMSILGLTIDYGPYGFLDAFDTNWTPNTTDLPGRRYSFGNQPGVALWNLTRLAEALLPLTNQKEDFEKGLATYRDTFQNEHRKMRLAKLGLLDANREEDLKLIFELDQILQAQQIDHTIFYQQFAEGIFPSKDMENWMVKFLIRKAEDSLTDPQSQDLMRKTNPVYIPRNWELYLAIQDIEKNEDLSRLNRMLEKCLNPYVLRTEFPLEDERRPDWARDLSGASQLSCSS